MDRRVCVVTGASRGVGRAVAVRLAAQGHRVALVARDPDGLAQAAALCSGATLPCPADVTDPGSAQEVLDRVADTWGPAEILVAAAGRNRSAKLGEVTDEHWQEMLDLNLTAVFRWLRQAVPPMAERGWGRAVVVSSIAGKRGFSYLSAYAAAKHGVVGLVRSVAMEVAHSGVTVNAVCPAYIDTGLTDATVEAITRQAGWEPDRAARHVRDLQPIGRMVTPEEVADAVWALILNGAQTGQSIHVDGGLVH